MPPTPSVPTPGKPVAPPTQVSGTVSFTPSGASKPPVQSAVKPKIGANTLSVVAVVLLVILVIVAGVAVAVAKTGLVHIPLASSLYKGPTPTRLVTTQGVDPNVFLERVSAKVNAAIQEGGVPPYRVTFTEQELTGALQGAIQSTVRDSDVRIDHLQLVSTPVGLELFGQIRNDTVTVTTLVELVPKIENGELLLEPIRVQVGDYTIPTSTARELSGSLFSRDFGAWKLNAGDMTLEGIRVFEGGLELTLSLKR